MKSVRLDRSETEPQSEVSVWDYKDLHIREPRAVTNQSAVRGAKPGVKDHLGSRSEEQRAVTGAQRSNRGVRELMASIKHE